MTSVQKRKWRNWSPSSHSVESQQGLPTESHCSHLRAPFRHFERLMTHPRGNYVNVLYLKASTKEILDRVWASAFYEANIPFNVVKHPTFIHAVHETSCLRMPAYRPPLYNAVRTRLLTAKRVDVEKKVEEKLGNSVGKYGVTMCCDGWDNIQNRPLLNVVQCGPSGDLFLGTIDTTGNHKDQHYVASQIRPFLEKVGVHNVVQVCTDNAPVMIAASRHIFQSISHLYVQGCATHCLDLLLEDWGKERMGEEVGEKGQDHFCLHQEPPRLTGHLPKVVSRFIHPFTCRNQFCHKLHHDRSTSPSAQCFREDDH